jgi:hypothetical protein
MTNAITLEYSSDDNTLILHRPNTEPITIDLDASFELTLDANFDITEYRINED